MGDRLGDLFDLFPDLPTGAPRAPVSERVRQVRSDAERMRNRVREHIKRKQQDIARNQAAWQRPARRPKR